MGDRMNVDDFSWIEKRRLVNHEGPYHAHPDLVEKLKKHGLLEYNDLSRTFEFSEEGERFRDEVYDYVEDQLSRDLST